MADDTGVKIVITGDATGAVQATTEATTGLDKLKTATGDVTKETIKNTDAVRENTEKFAENRRELREAGRVVSDFLGLQDGQLLALGKTSAAIFSVVQALDFLKSVMAEVKSSIQGPLNIEIPPDAPAHISAAATALNEYAAARQAVTDAAKSPENLESGVVKQLNQELSLVKQVLAAERDKAEKELELHKGEMSTEEYTATKANIGLIFDAQNQAEVEKNRRALIGAKSAEATNLEIDANNKRDQASQIKVTPENVEKSIQETLDTNAAQARTAIPELKELLALIERQQKNAKDPGSVPEYEGSFGAIRQASEGFKLYERYAGMSLDDARKQEQTRLTQAQTEITLAGNYSAREDQNRTRQKELMTTAGEESGKSANLKEEVRKDSAFEQQQNNVDSYVASLHQSSARQVIGASTQTVDAVQKFTAAVVGGFRDVHGQFMEQQGQLNVLRQQIQEVARNGSH